MDYLAPPLNALLQIQLKIKNGYSVRSAIQAYVTDSSECPFAKEVEFWLFCMKTGKKFTPSPTWAKKHYRLLLLELLQRGWKGEPILPALQELEEELKAAALYDLEQQIQKLPFISFIPLFLFQVPAFFLLLLAPLLMELKESLNY